jgi:hypothetical protein
MMWDVRFEMWEGIAHRAWSIGRNERDGMSGETRQDDRWQKTDDRESLVGEAFSDLSPSKVSRDITTLTISTI